MSRWQPDARGRLAQAALELFLERGFDQTTVQDIAERAGVTERTFFRYYADKREVLFDGAGQLQKVVLGAIADAPDEATPIEIVGQAYAAAGRFLQERSEFARQRSIAIALNPSLQERELHKLASMSAAVSRALIERGAAARPAALAAEAGATAFRVAFEWWVGIPLLGPVPAPAETDGSNAHGHPAPGRQNPPVAADGPAAEHHADGPDVRRGDDTLPELIAAALALSRAVLQPVVRTGGDRPVSDV